MSKDRQNHPISYVIGTCIYGKILVAKSRSGICSILLGDSKEILVEELKNSFPKRDLTESKNMNSELKATNQFVENPASKFSLPLDIQGTEFQEKVWKTIQAIPRGSTSSYTDIAKGIGSPNSIRAVANACGSNILAVAIPCHRVVKKDGGIAGYRWGIRRKRQLLRQESKNDSWKKQQK